MLKSRRVKLDQRTALALRPSDVAKAYNLPQNVDVSKRTVAILELGGGYNSFDVMLYCWRNGYKVPNLMNVLVDGALEVYDPQGADGEVCLDIDVVAGVAQGCRIVVVFAPNTDQGFIDGLAKCVALNPDAISISWGGPLDQWNPDTVNKIDSLILQAGNKGIPVFVASGDNGSSDGESGNVTDYPACSPFAIACGGTHLELNTDGSRASETAWNGSGGGITPTGRKSPDVSGNADPNTGYEISIDFFSATVGGTSGVAPFYAAYQCILNSLAGKHVGNLKSKIYSSPECFHDITQGSNGSYNAGPGYDCVTGMGAIDGTKFANKWKS